MKKTREIIIKKYNNGELQYSDTGKVKRSSRRQFSVDKTWLGKLALSLLVGILAGMLLAGTMSSAELPYYFGFMAMAVGILVAIIIEMAGGKLLGNVDKRFDLGNKTVVVYNNLPAQRANFYTMVLFFVIGLIAGITIWFMLPQIYAFIHILSAWL